MKFIRNRNASGFRRESRHFRIFAPKNIFVLAHAHRKHHGTAADPHRVGEVRRVVLVERHRARRQKRHGGQHRRRRGHLPLVRRRRTMHLPPQGDAHQQLHVRLRLLRQPPLQRHPQGNPLRHRTGGHHHGVLPPQLHRRPLPLKRRGAQPRLHHGTPCGHRPGAPHPPTLQRLHPSEKHPRRLPRTARRGRTLRRPHERQHRNPQRGVAETARPRERPPKRVPTDETHPTRSDRE